MHYILIFCLFFVVVPKSLAQQCKILFDSVQFTSKDKKWAFLARANDNEVVHLASGKKLNLGNGKPIFSNEGSIFALFSKTDKRLYVYSDESFKPAIIQINLDHVVDIRQGVVSGIRNDKTGYLIFDLQTGKELYHAEATDIVLKESSGQQLSFVRFPKPMEIGLNRGFIESVQLNTIKTDLVVSEKFNFDQAEEGSVSNDFLKIKKDSRSTAWTYLNKATLSEIPAHADIASIYTIAGTKSTYHVVQEKTQLKIYKNDQMVFQFNAPSYREMKIIGYADFLGSFVGWDPKLRRLFKVTPFNTKAHTVEIGPSFDPQLGAASVINSGNVLFTSPDQVQKTWNLDTGEVL